MARVDDLLLALREAARANEKDRFDGLEHELLALFDGGFDGMPEEVYEQYLAVDRLWPIALDESGTRGRTLEIRLPVRNQLWLEKLAARTDRSLSAVIAECLDTVRTHSELEDLTRARLESARSQEGD